MFEFALFLIAIVVMVAIVCFTVLVAKGKDVKQFFVFDKIRGWLLWIFFCFASVYVACTISFHSLQIFKVIANSAFPIAYDPIARFAAKVDWEKQDITLDASISKVYKNKIDKYIWRIDDGTAMVGQSSMTHHFNHPGFYTVKLSIVDVNGRSDQASCEVNIPPPAIRKLIVSDQQTKDGKITSSEYKYVPEGLYFNYSKRYLEGNSASGMQSPFVNDDCGLSLLSYNNQGDFDVNARNMMLRDSVVTLLPYILAIFLLRWAFAFCRRNNWL